VREFLEQNPRVRFHFTPTYSSWLNQVELWFAKIEREVSLMAVLVAVGFLSWRTTSVEIETVSKRNYFGPGSCRRHGGNRRTALRTGAAAGLVAALDVSKDAVHRVWKEAD
jgi:hypothetical protein